MASYNSKIIRILTANSYKLISLLLCSSCLIIFLSCQSSPKQFDALLEQTHLPLDTGATIYLLANTKQARSIIDILPIQELKDEQTVQLLDRTDFVAVALFPYESGRHFQLAAWGKYPSTRARIALNSNKYWEKYTNEDGTTYWHAEISRLSIAMEADRAFALSSLARQPVNPKATSPGAQIPDGFVEFARGTALSCWINNPGPMLAEMLNSAGIPLRLPARQLFINFYPMPENEYDVLIRMIFLNEAQARGTISMLNFASGLAPADLDIASIFLTNSPVQNRNIVDIKTARLTENDLKTLLGMLLVNN